MTKLGRGNNKRKPSLEERIPTGTINEETEHPLDKPNNPNSVKNKKSKNNDPFIIERTPRGFVKINKVSKHFDKEETPYSTKGFYFSSQQLEDVIREINKVNSRGSFEGRVVVGEPVYFVRAVSNTYLMPSSTLEEIRTWASELEKRIEQDPSSTLEEKRAAISFLDYNNFSREKKKELPPITLYKIVDGSRVNSSGGKVKGIREEQLSDMYHEKFLEFMLGALSIEDDGRKKNKPYDNSHKKSFTTIYDLLLKELYESYRTTPKITNDDLNLIVEYEKYFLPKEAVGAIASLFEETAKLKSNRRRRDPISDNEIKEMITSDLDYIIAYEPRYPLPRSPIVSVKKYGGSAFCKPISLKRIRTERNPRGLAPPLVNGYQKNEFSESYTSPLFFNLLLRTYEELTKDPAKSSKSEKKVPELSYEARVEFLTYMTSIAPEPAKKELMSILEEPVKEHNKQFSKIMVGSMIFLRWVAEYFKKHNPAQLDPFFNRCYEALATQHNYLS